MMMRNSGRWIAGAGLGAMIITATAVFGVTHYKSLVNRDAQTPNTAEAPPALKFPTVEQMCKAAGAGAAEMASCVSDETSAAEFVGAWLELNGFLANGRIDVEQIQLAAEVDASDQATATAVSGDPADPDPLGSGDASDSALSPDVPSPLADTPAASRNSPAQIALLCLTTAGDDWLKMHDCIAHNDPSSTLEGSGP